MINTATVIDSLKNSGDIVALGPQIVGRFYGDLNRLGQRSAGSSKPQYYMPERWIGSSTQAVNPPHIPSGGLSTCVDMPGATLKELLAHEDIGPQLLGESRYSVHNGSLRVLIKILDAAFPIPFHVHADDQFVASHPDVYTDEQFGKDEAYHFLEAPKGPCPYTHIGIYPGVDAKAILSAMSKSSDHVLELSPGAIQNFGEGYFTRAGLLHRPGSALTLEIQQPSDVYTLFQYDFGGEPLPREALHPGFASLEDAANAVVRWEDNLKPDLLQANHLKPTPVENVSQTGAKAEWIYPPHITDKFSGMRLTVDTQLTLRADDPCILFVWSGNGTLDGRKIGGNRGATGEPDEFFIGIDAMQRGVEFKNTSDEPLVAFALFAAKL